MEFLKMPVCLLTFFHEEVLCEFREGNNQSEPPLVDDSHMGTRRERPVIKHEEPVDVGVRSLLAHTFAS